MAIFCKYFCAGLHNTIFLFNIHNVNQKSHFRFNIAQDQEKPNLVEQDTKNVQIRSAAKEKKIESGVYSGKTLDNIVSSWLYFVISESERSFCCHPQ